jgi:diacylglycerol kinase (ATP)
VSIPQEFSRSKQLRNPPLKRRSSHERVAGKENNVNTILVVNPKSHSGQTGKDWDSLFSKIKDILGDNLEVAFCKKSDDGSNIAREFLKKGYNKIVAIGGDGTLNAVARGFFEEPVGIYSHSTGHSGGSARTYKEINPDAVLGIVPSGTRNVLAKSLGLPEGILECCKVFSSGEPRKLDVIQVTTTNQEDHSSTVNGILLNAAEMGLAAEIIDRSKKVRQVVNNRMVSTITSIASTLPTYQSNECEISIERNRKKFAVKMTMGVVANGQFLGGGFRIAPNANMSDGLLDLVILKDSGSLKMLDELINMKTGEYNEEDKIIYRQAKKVTLRSKERDVTVTVDGEPIGILPATFEVIPHALTVKM